MKKPSLKHLPLSLFCVFLVRSLILNAIKLNEVFVIAILAGLTAFYELQLETKKIEELYKRLDILTDNDKKQTNLIVENYNKQETLLKDTHNVISTMKVASGIRNVR